MSKLTSNNSYVEKLALVISKSGDGYVTCEYGTAGLCGGCKEKSDDCVPELFSKPQSQAVFLLKNTCVAEINQVVRVGIPERSLLLGAFIAYGIPLLFIICCSGLGVYFSQNSNSDIAAMIGAFIGLVLGFLTAAVLAKILGKTIWNPKMLGILPLNTQCSNSTKNH